MKKLVILAFTLVSLTACQFVTYTGPNGAKQAVAKGPVATKTLDLKDFQSIVMNGHADVTYVQSPDFSVELTANEDAFDKLVVSVEDGTLIVKPKDNIQLRAQKLELLVKAPEMESVVVNGAADFDLDNYTSQNPMSITVNGAGDIDLKNAKVPSLQIVVNGAGDIDVTDVETEDLKVVVSGAGDAKVSGHAVNGQFTISGAGDIDVRELSCENLTTHKNGVGRVKKR